MSYYPRVELRNLSIKFTRWSFLWPAKKIWMVYSKASWDTDSKYVNKDGEIWRVKPILRRGSGKLVPWKMRSLDKCIKLVNTWLWRRY